MKSFRQFRIPSEASTALVTTLNSEHNLGNHTSDDPEIPVTSLTEHNEQRNETVNPSSEVGESLTPSASGQVQFNTTSFLGESSFKSIVSQNQLPIKSEVSQNQLPSNSDVTPNQIPSNSDVSPSQLFSKPDVNTNQLASTTSPQRNSTLPSVETLTCPVCRVPLHPTRPFSQLHQDRDLQKIIYLLRPGLAESMHLCILNAISYCIIILNLYIDYIVNVTHFHGRTLSI